MMKNRFFIPLMAMGIIMAAGCKKDKQDSMGDGEPMEVDVAEVVMDSVMIYKEYPGKLTSSHSVDIVARVDGTLKTRNYNGGDIVKTGQVLFTIDDTQYRNAVQQAQGQLDNAISQRDYYTKQYAAMQKALESDAVSQMEVLQAKSNLDESIASIKEAQASLHNAQTNLGYCTIRAPFTGRISAENLMVGSYLAGSASPVNLATLYDNTKYTVNFYIEDATYIHMITSNGKSFQNDYDSIPINFSEKLAHNYSAKLNYVAPDINASTGTMLLRGSVDNTYDELRDGMFINVSLPYQNDPQALLIEDAAIGTDQQGKYVYVVNEKNEVVYTPIKVGSVVKDGTMRVVTSGLKKGQRYVNKALLKVRDGMKVKPVAGK